MAFNVTSDTVVKILVRRGLETERTATLLSEGELGYSIDTRRLFIGDGYTLGGQPVGNINFGVVANRFNFNSIAQPGDTLIENFCPYAYDGTVWYSTNPQIYNDITSNINSIEFTNANLLRVSPNCIGQGLALDYAVQSNGSLNNTLQKIYGTVQFDARYISLCANSNSFYFGNIFNKTVTDNLGATVNVADNIFINQHAPNPYQLKLYAKDPSGSNNSLMQAVSGDLKLTAKNSVKLYSGTGTAASNSYIYSSLQVIGSVTQNVSDKRLKNNLGNIENSLEKISKLNGIYYTYNDTAKQLGIYTEGRKVGIIAQEVQQVLPEAVKPAPFDIKEQGTSISGENYLTVQYEKLIPLMIQAINELNHKVETLEAKVK